jgi:glycogen(starch) synthase
MRILTVGNMYPPHHHGGYELVWQSAVEHLRSAGHDVRVLTTDLDTGADDRDPRYVARDLHWHHDGADFHQLRPWSAWSLARHNQRVLSRQIDDFDPDIVSWWSMGGLTLSLIEAVRRRGLPAVAFVHDDWLDYGPRVDPWLSLFTGRRRRIAPLAERAARVPARVDFGAAADYVFVSEHTRRVALDLGVGLRAERTAVAHSGIDPVFLDPAPDREWQWRLLYVGRIDPRKGIDTAIEALGHLPPEAHLTIAGGSDPGEQDRLAGLAAGLGLAGRVEFAGHRDRDALARAYADADAVVFPVRWDEPWGLVPLESMGRGRAVVATGRGGSAEYLRGGENCLLFPAGDAAALAAALSRLARDAALRARLREAGLATAGRHTEATFNAAVEEAVARSDDTGRIAVKV